MNIIEWFLHSIGQSIDFVYQFAPYAEKTVVLGKSICPIKITQLTQIHILTPTIRL